MKEPRQAGKIIIDPERCKGCGICVAFCPHGSITLGAEVDHRGIRVARFLDHENKCTGCTFCAIVCPDVAIEVYRKGKEKASPATDGPGLDRDPLVNHLY
jgi:2-oxoglutarate ferredoxin oxidoreductase subunit delta